MRFRSLTIGLALAIFGLGAAVGIGLAANSISGDSVGLSADPLSASVDSPTLSPEIEFAAKPIPTAAPSPNIASAVPMATERRFTPARLAPLG